MENYEQKQPKLKILQLVQKYFANVGISPILAAQPYPFNGKLVMGSATLVLYVICSLMDLFYNDKTFAENMVTICMCSLAALIFFTLMILILNVEELFRIINDFETIVNTSRFSKKKFNSSFDSQCWTCSIRFFRCYFSIEIFSIKNHFQWYPSIWTEIKWNQSFYLHSNYTRAKSISMVRLHLFHLLEHRFRERSIRIASSNVVSFWSITKITLIEAN